MGKQRLSRGRWGTWANSLISYLVEDHPPGSLLQLKGWPEASRRGATRFYFTREALSGCGPLSHAHLGALLR